MGGIIINLFQYSVDIGRIRLFSYFFIFFFYFSIELLFSFQLSICRGFFFYNFKRYSDKPVSTLYKYRTNTFFFLFFCFCLYLLIELLSFFQFFFFRLFFFRQKLLPVEGFFLYSFGRYSDKPVSTLYRYKTNTSFFLFFYFYLYFLIELLFSFQLFSFRLFSFRQRLLSVKDFFSTILEGILINLF